MPLALQMHLHVAIGIRFGDGVGDRAGHLGAMLFSQSFLVATWRRVFCLLPLDSRIILSWLVLVEELLGLLLKQDRHVLAAVIFIGVWPGVHLLFEGYRADHTALHLGWAIETVNLLLEPRVIVFVWPGYLLLDCDQFVAESDSLVLWYEVRVLSSLVQRVLLPVLLTGIFARVNAALCPLDHLIDVAICRHFASEDAEFDSASANDCSLTVVSHRNMVVPTNRVEFQLADRSAFNQALAASCEILLLPSAIEFKPGSAHFKRFVATDEGTVTRAVLHRFVGAGEAVETTVLLHGAANLLALEEAIATDAPPTRQFLKRPSRDGTRACLAVWFSFRQREQCRAFRLVDVGFLLPACRQGLIHVVRRLDCEPVS